MGYRRIASSGTQQRRPPVSRDKKNLCEIICGECEVGLWAVSVAHPEFYVVVPLVSAGDIYEV